MTSRLTRASTRVAGSKDNNNQHSEAPRKSPERTDVFKTGVAVAVISGLFGLTNLIAGGVIDQHPEITKDTVSVCVNASDNVKRQLANGINNPRLLRLTNPVSVDTQCGDEVDLAHDIQDGSSIVK